MVGRPIPAGSPIEAEHVSDSPLPRVGLACARDERGWYVEMRIPLSTLRYGAGGAQDWGLNFERRIRRNSEQSMWAPVPRQSGGREVPIQAGARMTG